MESVTVPDSITPGELDRRLNRMEDHMGQGFQDLKQGMHELTASISASYVRKDVLAEINVGLEKRIASLERWQTWALRGVMGTVLAGLITAAFEAGLIK